MGFFDKGPAKPTEAQLNAANEARQGRPPVHEGQPMSAREQRIVDDAAAKQQRS
jgi:hypothetical protein